ncbi:unnamed protein product [Prorocentrum cordatum]|uniref:Rieske domain-containing protein n=1 Tax=Prorocentrum cordatum TaxID=2364126 RepID=A0ABN9S189_9DINO|nr:unnamed protein product [Polarella glacialis]
MRSAYGWGGGHATRADSASGPSAALAAREPLAGAAGPPLARGQPDSPAAPSAATPAQKVEGAPRPVWRPNLPKTPGLKKLQRLDLRASKHCPAMRAARACAVAALTLLVLRSSLTFVAPSTAGRGRSSRTAAKYTTQTILPALAWIKTGFREISDLAPTELRAVNLGGVDVLVGKTEAGKLFCVGNLCPHLGTPMSEGADVIGDTIVCPLHGSSWKVGDGELIDWCPSPPIIGPLTGLVIEKKKLAIFEARSGFFGGDIEVQVDTNAKKAYEADYWKGILDAQGKNDGTYY